MGHGDGLGPGDHGYKFLKKIFRNKVCQGLFGLLPPAVGVGLANWLSRRSRAVTGQIDEQFLGEEREWLIIYCKEILKTTFFDYFIFGHRHLPIDFTLGPFTGPSSVPGATAFVGTPTAPASQSARPPGALASPAGIPVSRYINLGDWIRYNTYAVFDCGELLLLSENDLATAKIIRR